MDGHLDDSPPPDWDYTYEFQYDYQYLYNRCNYFNPMGFYPYTNSVMMGNFVEPYEQKSRPPFVSENLNLTQN